MQRRIFRLLSPIAGVLLFQSVQAQTVFFADGTNTPPGTPAHIEVPPGFTATVSATGLIDSSIVLARSGGTITGTGDLTLNVTGSGTQVLNAVGTGSLISMAGKTVINMTNAPNATTDNNRGAYANLGTVILNTGSTITLTGAGSQAFRNNRGVEADHEGATLTATGTTIDMEGSRQIGAFAHGAATEPGGGVVSLTDCNINLTGEDGYGLGTQSGSSTQSPSPTTVSATNTRINMIGDRNICAVSFDGAVILTNCLNVTLNGSSGWGFGAFDYFGGGQSVSATVSAKNTMLTLMGNSNEIVATYYGGVITLDNSIINGSGINNFGLVAYSDGNFHPLLPSTINVLNNSTVTSTGSGSSAALISNGSVLNVVGSAIRGDFNGIEISDDSNTTGRDNRVALTSSTLTNLAGGNGEAAFKVEGAHANIAVTDSTVNSGVDSTQHTLLDVTQTQQVAGQVVGKVPPAVENATVTQTSQVGINPSLVDLTADNSILNGDIQVDATSSANVKLEHNTFLNGAINENNLTGATGINPTEQVTQPIAPGFPPFTVNLGIDSTSTWNMRASSTLNTLKVNPMAQVNFADPPADPFKTLVMNNLVGTGGIFRENNNLAAIKGDLIEIVSKSEGQHLLTFNNRTGGSDLPINTALLVVRTPDGGARFTGQEDGGTFRYFVVHGDGSSVTPVRNDWYLVRGDEITPPQITPPPGGGQTPPGFTPGDNLPLPSEPGPIRLSRINALTPGANAAIGTFSATMPLFYADMETLVQRLGELRLQAQEAPPPTTPIPLGTSKEEGKAVVPPPPPPPAPPSGGGVWVRGLGSGYHINDQVSRSFDQQLGGFQIGADKRLITRYGDLYLGGFLGYFHANRQFENQPFNQDSTGTTNAFSVGAYGTLIHPSGFYADLVLKYTELWNDFDAPNVLSTLGLGPSSTADYSVPAFGASLEIGKRWDLGHFFVEPQGQIEGAWAGSTSYTVSNGLRVNADSQTSLRGRLGVRAGYHIDWSSRSFEPYAKVSVINEFLGGDQITTNQTSFSPTLSGVGIQAAAGLTARLTNSIYLYGEYDYTNSDKIRIPWAVDAGLRWQW